MNFFENNLVELINLEEEVSSMAAESHDEFGQIASQMRDIIEEFKRIHVGLVKQDMLMKKLAEVQI